MGVRISAVFDNYAQANQAVDALRRLGVNDADLAVLSRNDIEGWNRHENAVHEDNAAERAGKGLAVGAGVGALFGLIAVAIPGVGPFITAGWLAEALGVTAGGAVAGAIVGGTSGAISTLLTKAGYTEDEARYYGSALDRGGVFVAVNTNTPMVTEAKIRDTLAHYGGRMPVGVAV
jgi:uncharacterized membrane protein